MTHLKTRVLAVLMLGDFSCRHRQLCQGLVTQTSRSLSFSPVVDIPPMRDSSTGLWKLWKTRLLHFEGPVFRMSEDRG